MKKQDTPNILLINPWIYDFAAYDFWAKPLGLLTLASILRDHGFQVRYIDCLDRFHPEAPQADPYTRYGRGPYHKTRIQKPGGCEDVDRTYSRYGIREKWFRQDLLTAPVPDVVFVTSLMTYWYPGVQDTIKIIKEIFPDTPVVLGGIYATLCHDHAVKCSDADKVVTGSGEKDILRLAEAFTGFSTNPGFDPDDINTYPYPAYDLQRKIAYVPILTSRGCPFSCAYCASHFLEPKRMRRDPGLVTEEIRFWHEKYDVKDFVFYDDALLADAETHAIPMLEDIIRSGLNVRFHTPNAIHIRGISKKIAQLMFESNFKTLRLGLETTAFEERNELDRKVTEGEFTQAVSHLKAAGFTRNQMGAYLLMGLPGQSMSSVEASVRTVRQSGITPVLAYYSPIPHTKLWQQAVDSSRYDLESDPIFTNNAILPCEFETFSWKTISHLKEMAAQCPKTSEVCKPRRSEFGDIMPLAFDSISHGPVAFGFFNIDSDMLLLENYFFFAAEFCGYISEMAEKDEKGAFESVWPVFHIGKAEDIGDLMGAIHKLRHTGFIGELYSRFPFPEKPEDFKQKPEGYKNRAIAETIIGKYATPVEIPFVVDKEEQNIWIGAYRFARPSFQELIRYVWRGGYPRWKDETRPDYVMTMNQTIAKSRKQIFEGIGKRSAEMKF